ncbi:FliH/SctL family protein [Thiomicrorhabdus sp.]|uniref:FliH/SctL family protein n=1 Tax=Thiomicrorhabdus sp. TaxID=2039724 RepID=UPI0029C85D05|nr:FliH/SctL family protein [Thiomicrorhabdus sp.]
MNDSGFTAFDLQRQQDDKVVPLKTRLLRQEELEQEVAAWQPKDFASQSKASSEQKVAPVPVDPQLEAQIRAELEKEYATREEAWRQQIHEEAFQEGFRQGLEKGETQGRLNGEESAKQSVRQAAEVDLQQFQKLVESIQTPYEALKEGLLSELTEFSFHIAEAVIKQQIEQHPQWILEAVEKAVEVLPENEDDSLKIFLNPEDLLFLQKMQYDALPNWQLEQNAELKRGECLVRQVHSQVANLWSARLDEIMQNYRRPAPVGDAEEKNLSANANEPTNTLLADEPS